MSTPVDVSVLITAYNEGATLRAAIESVLQERGVSLEVVVVLDGATEEEARSLEQYGDPRINVLAPGRVGRCRALNLGLEVCTAPYVRILDADDELISGGLKAQVNYLDANPQIDALGGQVLQSGPRGPVPFRHRSLLAPAEVDRRLRRGRMPIAHPTMAMRRAWVTRLGGYDVAMLRCEDLDLLLRGSTGENYANLEVPLTVLGVDTPFPTWRYWRREEKYRRIAVRRHRAKIAKDSPVRFSPSDDLWTVFYDFPRWLVQELVDVLRRTMSEMRRDHVVPTSSSVE